MLIKGHLQSEETTAFCNMHIWFHWQCHFLLTVFGSRSERDTAVPIFCSTALAALEKCTFSGKFSLDMHFDQRWHMSQRKSASKTSPTQWISTGYSPHSVSLMLKTTFQSTSCHWLSDLASHSISALAHLRTSPWRSGFCSLFVYWQLRDKNTANTRTHSK